VRVHADWLALRIISATTAPPPALKCVRLLICYIIRHGILYLLTGTGLVFTWLWQPPPTMHSYRRLRTQCALSLIDHQPKETSHTHYHVLLLAVVMPTHDLSEHLSGRLQPRRKREPRKLNYLKCTFCRQAKVKVIVPVPCSPSQNQPVDLN
jgi:hypothetical protein